MSKPFTFSVDDADVMMSHLVLQDGPTVRKIAASPEWVEKKTMTAEVKVNGIDIPGHVFEEMLKHWYLSMERRIEEQTEFLKLATAVETAAETLLEAKAKKLIDKMADLSFELENMYVELKE